MKRSQNFSEETMLPLTNTSVSKIDKILVRLIDTFYPIFKTILNKTIYRFLAVGGICFVLNFIIFHSSYYMIYVKTISSDAIVRPHSLAFMSAMAVTVPAGFYLLRKFVFTGSVQEVKIQFIRYLISTLINVFLSVFILDLFIKTIGMNVTIAFVANVIIIQSANYVVQKKFSFK